MCGGRQLSWPAWGNRLRPLTCKLPKPMVPLLDKPVMEYALDHLKRHGITDVAVTVQYLPETITGYFKDGSDFGMRLTYSREEKPLGTAGSVLQAAEDMEEAFLVISGDGLTDIDLSARASTRRRRSGYAGAQAHGLPAAYGTGDAECGREHRPFRGKAHPARRCSATP